MSESLKSPLSEVIDDLWEQRSGLGPEDTAARAEVVAAVDERAKHAILRDHGVDG